MYIAKMSCATNNNILLSLKNSVRSIYLNRPSKRNAINHEMYKSLTQILNEDAENNKIGVSILTGIGDFYSSGNDFTKAVQGIETAEDIMQTLTNVKKFVEALINYPKVLIAVVNGPAIGIAATTLGLCDIVYATDKSWFQTPFTDLALCPEGCSSYMFPKLIGKSKASEMLLLGQRLSVEEAYQFGFVSKIVPQGDLTSFLQKLNELYGKLPSVSIKASKKLMNYKLKERLIETNELEVSELKQRFQSEEYRSAVRSIKNKIKSKP